MSDDSKASIWSSVNELIKSGKDPKQAVASAYANARKAKKALETDEEFSSLDELNEEAQEESLESDESLEDQNLLAKALRAKFMDE